MFLEHSVQNSIFRAFGTRADMRIWRQNTGVAAYGRRKVRYGVPGAADITGLIPVVQVLECPHCGGELSTPPLGVRLEIEVKSAVGRASADQVAYGAMIRRFGGIYVLARSVADVEEAIRAYR